ncbi:NUDIX hydrolase [Pyrobaculum aerophilum]|uniref:DNA mismatch repair protein MutT n=1 Tax=Pyrobaculum aerophilum TaxID=13773 RepID=A0A371R415_9CREN|nr:NUDIX domain-containing protein [Pyrobaculum aerophilum]RFA98539.1 DNA mismatch repair protein MutT [Pyrobaculum aerophilum]RFA99243.1 DNA mismatch repair protein MutT [Pyrobaculum aerophilum]
MTKKCIVASGVLVENGKVLMVRHKRLGVYIYPGGHVEHNETPIEAVKREFEEETGIVVEPIGFTYGIIDENAVERPMPLVILEEVVKYPEETHIHFDLIYLVKRVGGDLKNGEWIDVREIDRIETFPNVRKVVSLALSTLYRLGKI